MPSGSKLSRTKSPGAAPKRTRSNGQIRPCSTRSHFSFRSKLAGNAYGITSIKTSVTSSTKPWPRWKRSEERRVGKEGRELWSAVQRHIIVMKYAVAEWSHHSREIRHE